MNWLLCGIQKWEKINPSEHKQLKLARSLTRGIIDRDLKPSLTERKSIQRILKYPPTRTLSGDERQLLWKFRFSLMSEKRALTKFLRSVEWSDVQEAKQAIELMGRWEMIDVKQAYDPRTLVRNAVIPPQVVHPVYCH